MWVVLTKQYQVKNYGCNPMLKWPPLLYKQLNQDTKTIVIVINVLWVKQIVVLWKLNIGISNRKCFQLHLGP